MIRNVEVWEAWERDYARSTPVDIDQNLDIVDALYEHAVSMGAFRDRDLLAGLETILYVAKVVNVS